MLRRALLSIALVALTPGAAGAADLPPDVQRSVTAYEQGRKLLEGGDCPRAIPLFEESIRYNESIGAHLSIAECRPGDPLAAWREYKRAEALARRKDDDRARYAHEHAAALEGRLALVRIVLPSARAHGLVDARTIDDAEVDDPIAVEAGDHLVEIVRADGTRTSKRIVAVVGQTMRVTADPIAPAAGPTSPPESDGKTRRTTGLVVGGAGLGLAIAGGVFGLLASSKLDDAKSACAAYPHCAPSNEAAARDANDAGRTDALLSTIGIGVGALALVAGAVLYFTAPRGTSAHTVSNAFAF